MRLNSSRQQTVRHRSSIQKSVLAHRGSARHTASGGTHTCSCGPLSYHSSLVSSMHPTKRVDARYVGVVKSTNTGILQLVNNKAYLRLELSTDRRNVLITSCHRGIRALQTFRQDHYYRCSSRRKMRRRAPLPPEKRKESKGRCI